MSRTEHTHGDLSPLAAWIRERALRRVLVLAPPSRRYVERVSSAIARGGADVIEFDGAVVHVPEEVLAAVERALVAGSADAIVAVGGGAPIGLGKALRLGHDVAFAAVPTTYAGSEMTNLYGVTSGVAKRTGRDDRVRPDLVVYDVALTLELPIAFTVQSLCNALAHVASTRSTDSLEPAIRDAAYAAAREVIAAIDALVADPRDAAARERAQRGAAGCAVAADRGTPGLQHAFAHTLGGALRLDHAALHSILLPRFLAHMRAAQPAIYHELADALAVADLPMWLVERLAHAGAPTTFAQLGVREDALRTALALRPELPVDLALAAFDGRPMTGHTVR